MRPVRALLLLLGLLGADAALADAALADAARAGDGLAAAIGKALFDRDWVAAPASTRATDGLGPLHNARSCAACHPAGGRAPLTLAADGSPAGPGLVLRFADPVYGRQLQTRAVHGQAAEGRLRVVYSEEPVRLDDGALVSLRRPHYTIEASAFGPPPVRLSARLAPGLRGAGLLAAVPDAVPAALADPDDRDGDGIRGRPGSGRFGLRADVRDLAGQIAEALLLDLGLASADRPQPEGDCTPAQAACRAGPHGDREGVPDVEVGAPILAAIKAYITALRPRQRTETTEQGERLFAAIGCAACHVPQLPVRAGEGASGMITAFTDLLLHDLGPDLADQGGEDDPAARLWRTAPLWDLGRNLAAGRTLLHDGRARDLLEAILWHGGEAGAARTRFQALGADDRAAFLAFLESL